MRSLGDLFIAKLNIFQYNRHYSHDGKLTITNCPMRICQFNVKIKANCSLNVKNICSVRYHLNVFSAHYKMCVIKPLAHLLKSVIVIYTKERRVALDVNSHSNNNQLTSLLDNNNTLHRYISKVLKLSGVKN